MSGHTLLLIVSILGALWLAGRRPLSRWLKASLAVVLGLIALLPDQARHVARLLGAAPGQSWPWFMMAAVVAAGLAHRIARRDGQPAPLIWPFLAFATVTGLGYAFLVPPMQVPDEPQHLLRAYQILRGPCVAPEPYEYPARLGELIRAFPPAVETRRQVTWGEIEGWYSVPTDQRVEITRGNTGDLYHCFTYLPQAAGLAIARAAGNSMIGMFIAARVSSLVSYLLLVWLAWQLLPAGRSVLLAIAGMPMAMHQSAAVSADTLSNGLCFVLCAYILRLAWDPAINLVRPVQIAWLVALSVAVALAKLTFWVALIAIVIPSERLNGRWRKAAVVAACAGFAILTTTAWNWANREKVQLIARNRIERGIDVQKNVEFARSNPAVISQGVMGSFYGQAGVWAEMFVGRLGSATIYLPWKVVTPYLLLLLLLAATGFRDMPIKRWHRVFFVAWTVAGTAFLLVLLFFLEAHPTLLESGVPQIPGYQGRYLIPFAFVFLMAFGRLTTVPSHVRAGLLGLGLLGANAAALSAIEEKCYPEAGAEPRIAVLPDITIDNSYTTQPAPPLPGSAYFGQAFRSSHNGLAGVDVLFATYMKVIPSGFVKLTLREESPGGPIVAESRLPASRLRDNVWTGMRFDARRNSAGKTFYLDIHAESFPPDYYLTVWLGPSDLHAGGDFYLDGSPMQRDCAFRTFYLP